VVLNSTPVGGCASDEQCEAIHDAERAYVGMVQMTTTTDFAWRCTTHAAFRGEARCVMSCDETADCGAGSVCDAGTCVQGTVPAPECLAAVQRYEVVAGDSFVVVGSLTGYRHRRIFDGTTCVTDVTAHPLRAGRFHKVEPPCTEPDSLTTLTPNPCRFVAADEPSSTLVPNGDGTFTETFTFRETQGMRIRLPGFTVNLADIVTPIPDFPGLYYSPLPFGYQIQLSIGGAFVGRLALVDAAVPERIRADSGGVLWVIDSGDAPASPPLRGQIIEFENGETGRKIGK
jgi:hypothetical protein